MNFCFVFMWLSLVLVIGQTKRESQIHETQTCKLNCISNVPSYSFNLPTTKTDLAVSYKIAIVEYAHKSIPNMSNIKD